jgi:tRNA-specific 2-thiouridylase
VTGKNKPTNSLIVSHGADKKSLFSRTLTSKNFSWLSGQPPPLPLVCQARIRYRQPLQSGTAKQSKSGLKVIFRKPQRAVTPGQFIVLYKNRQMLGGGTIGNS